MLEISQCRVYAPRDYHLGSTSLGVVLRVLSECPRLELLLVLWMVARLYRLERISGAFDLRYVIRLTEDYWGNWEEGRWGCPKIWSCPDTVPTDAVAQRLKIQNPIRERDDGQRRERALMAWIPPAHGPCFRRICSDGCFYTTEAQSWVKIRLRLSAGIVPGCVRAVVSNNSRSISAGNVGATAMIPTSEATEQKPQVQKGDGEAQESRWLKHHTAQNKVSWVETEAERARDFCHWLGKCPASFCLCFYQVETLFCTPRLSPTSASRVYHRGTHADPPRATKHGRLGILMGCTRTRERGVNVEYISVAAMGDGEARNPPDEAVFDTRYTARSSSARAVRIHRAEAALVFCPTPPNPGPIPALTLRREHAHHPVRATCAPRSTTWYDVSN
ncbi:hypothetical protein B0H14DRAFT_3614351 [Mycena olivaceomarginata]|nr:hypothetical protein B0H14DRAFT_3614351 [Mycena olivaceomarginata]